MNNFFDIRSVVVVGASEQEGKVGNTMLKNLSFFSGEKFGVNPKGGSYEGIKFYKSISDLPITPDIAVFVIPARFVEESLIEAGEKGINRIIVISAGFKEVGNLEGEKNIIKIIDKYNIILIGPNCLGYLDTSRNLNLTFGVSHFNIYSGPNNQNVAMISQSGAAAVALTDWAILRNVGFSKMISMGNKTGVDENYFLKQLKYDNQTKVIALYLESIVDGKRFFKITKKLSKKYPIVLVKSGVSAKGKKAAESHTGALASKKEILQSAFSAAGIHFTQELEYFFLWTQIFSKTDIGDVPDELVILTNAGGLGVMATDHCETHGVKLSKFSSNEISILKQGLSELSSFFNPIDILGDATSQTYKQILNNLLKLDKKRAILLMLTAQSTTDVENIAYEIINFKKQNPQQFIMVSFMGGDRIINGRKLLLEAGILHYNYPVKAIISFSTLIKQKKWQETKEIKIEKFTLPKNIEELKDKLKKEKKFCGNDLVGEILGSFGINYQNEIIVKNEEDVKNAYKIINSDLCVAKISSPDIPHKSDIGGVILNIKSLQQAIDSFNEILKNASIHRPDAIINGVTFAQMVIKTSLTRKIFVGFKRDQSFGNILIVGMGGIFVNVFEDVSRRIGLVGKKEIKQMLKELKTYPILKGTRGQAGIDFDKLIEIIFKLQFVFKELTDISEIDINPIFSDDNDSIIIDAKFYL